MRTSLPPDHFRGSPSALLDLDEHGPPVLRALEERGKLALPQEEEGADARGPLRVLLGGRDRRPLLGQDAVGDRARDVVRIALAGQAEAGAEGAGEARGEDAPPDLHESGREGGAGARPVPPSPDAASRTSCSVAHARPVTAAARTASLRLCISSELFLARWPSTSGTESAGSARPSFAHSAAAAASHARSSDAAASQHRADAASSVALSASATAACSGPSMVIAGSTCSAHAGKVSAAAAEGGCAASALSASAE